MSTPVTYVGNSYSIPAYGDTGYAQGTGNLSSYLIALATGSLSLSGGSFPLTADANFGASFGLVALYLKTVTANLATAGFIRMANTDLIEWRNGANGGNDTFGTNTTDQLTYTGGDIKTATAGSGYVVTTPDGTKTYRIYVDNNGELTTLELT